MTNVVPRFVTSRSLVQRCSLSLRTGAPRGCVGFMWVSWPRCSHLVPPATFLQCNATSDRHWDQPSGSTVWIKMAGAQKIFRSPMEHRHSLKNCSLGRVAPPSPPTPRHSAVSGPWSLPGDRGLFCSERARRSEDRLTSANISLLPGVGHLTVWAVLCDSSPTLL
jgi:hypothetical protein